MFQKLVEDLKDIEVVGIDIGREENVDGTVVSMLEDNLGSHEIGGEFTLSILFNVVHCEGVQYLTSSSIFMSAGAYHPALGMICLRA